MAQSELIRHHRKSDNGTIRRKRWAKLQTNAGNNSKLLIGYGGSQSIDTPGRYSKVAGKLLQDIAIHTERFYDYSGGVQIADADMSIVSSSIQPGSRLLFNARLCGGRPFVAFADCIRGFL